MKDRTKALEAERRYRAAHPDRLKESRARRAEQRSEYNRKYREAHREERNEYARAWRAAHPEKVKEYTRKWRAAHAEEQKAATAAWREANPDLVRKYRKAYRDANRDALYQQLKEYRKRTPECRRKEHGMVFRPGQTIAGMRAAQNGLCDICALPLPDGRNCHVDHCHTTGYVRALLCQNCNMALGHLKEDPARARAAAEYMERHAQENQQVGNSAILTEEEVPRGPIVGSAS